MGKDIIVDLRLKRKDRTYRPNVSTPCCCASFTDICKISPMYPVGSKSACSFVRRTFTTAWNVQQRTVCC